MNFIPSKQNEISNFGGNRLCLELYTQDEQILLIQLSNLFSNWHKTLQCNAETCSLEISYDGFYPGYLQQPTKLLFIGRENLELGDNNYLEVLYEAIKDNVIGGKSLNRSRFHRRILYLTYALKYGIKDFRNGIPYADEISPLFGSDISYAFMNVSKFSNNSGYWAANWALISKFVELSTGPKNYIAEEIALLDPDIIITMNLAFYFDKIGTFSPVEGEHTLRSGGKPYELILNQKRVLVLDVYHFSYWIGWSDKVLFDRTIETLEALKNRFGLKCFPTNE